MLRNRDIIIFADDWGRYPSTMQHIGRILTEQNRVLWIGSLGLRKPQLSTADLKRVWEKLRGMLVKKESVGKIDIPVRLFSPFVLPFHDNRLIRFFNNQILKQQLRKKLLSVGFQDTIVITSSPVVAGVLGKIGERSSFYFCLDDYKLFQGAFSSLPYFEELLMEKVAASFSVSEVLRQTRTPRTGKSYFLPQGVNFAHFNNAIRDRKKNSKPVFGFFGLLAEWVNLELIVNMAKYYPEYEFVIIGKPVSDVAILNRAPNIKFLGEIPYQELPQIAKQFDVGLIPFYLNELTIAVNPIKLIEYFALGIPVVSIAMPEVKKFSGHSFAANDESDFIKYLPLALSDNTPEKNAEREAIAREYSWESIVENISVTIEECELS